MSKFYICFPVDMQNHRVRKRWEPRNQVPKEDSESDTSMIKYKIYQQILSFWVYKEYTVHLNQKCEDLCTNYLIFFSPNCGIFENICEEG